MTWFGGRGGGSVGVKTHHDGERFGGGSGGAGDAEVEAVLADGGVVQPHLLPCTVRCRDFNNSRKSP
jgi:hypothetical protein